MCREGIQRLRMQVKHRRIPRIQGSLQVQELLTGAYTYLPGYAIYLDMQSLKSDKSGVELWGIPPRKLTRKLP